MSAFLRHLDVDLGATCTVVCIPVSSGRSENAEITGDRETEPYDALPLYKATKTPRLMKTHREFGLAYSFFDGADDEVSNGDYIICAHKDDHGVYLAVFRRGDGGQVHETRFLYLIEVTVYYHCAVFAFGGVIICYWRAAAVIPA